MSKFSNNISPYVRAEIAKAKQAQNNRDESAAFTYLENAHVLGQESTYWHVKVHFLMLCWGIKNSDLPEVVGQLFRIIGAVLLTAIKGVPVGNTGGSNVSPLRVMPVQAEHADIIAKAKAKPD